MVGKILVAGAIPTHRIFLKAVLTAASYQVSEATEPAEMLQIANKTRPDLVILDATVDDSDWVRAMADVQQRDGLRHPVLAVDREYSPASRLLWLSAGANDVLPAPINEMVLRARVRNLVRAHALQIEAQERALTASELGFGEAQSEFHQRAQILVAAPDCRVPKNLETALAACTNTGVEVSDLNDLLAHVSFAKTAPDVIVLSAEMLPDRSALTTIAEIRSRSQSRNASILVLNDAGDRLLAVSALDLGANDTVEADSTSQEIQMRITGQIHQKQIADQMRASLLKGMEMAVIDELTGLYNRRYALPHLQRIAANAVATGKPYAVLLLDLDWFKSINDSFGHAAGDLVLRSIAQQLRDNLRSADLVARIGGEEFMIIMPDTDLEAARLGAERLRKVIAAEPVQYAENQDPIRVTASIGVAAGIGFANEDVAGLIQRADQALYAAKGHGRNIVEADRCAA